MRNINQTYKELFSDKHKEFAEKNNKAMNSTNIELWFSSKYIFYTFAVIGNIASFFGCAYGIHLYLSDSMPLVLSWTIGIIFGLGLEVTFIFAYQYALVKVFQKRYKYALPYLFIASFYVLVYFPTTFGFESFVIRTDKKVETLNKGFSKDSINISSSFNTKIDSLNNRILGLEKERNSLEYYVDITRNNNLIQVIYKDKKELEEKKENRLLTIAEKNETKVSETEKGLIQTSARHLNLAIIILLYVFIMYTAISVIKYFADEEYRQMYKAMNKSDDEILDNKIVLNNTEKKKSLNNSHKIGLKIVPKISTN